MTLDGRHRNGKLSLTRKRNTPTNKRGIIMANEKEFDTPKTVNVTELAEAVAKKTAEEILKKTTLPAAPTALTEKVADMGKPYNYRPEVIRLMKENDTLRMPRDEANKVSDLIEKMGPRGFVDKDGHRFEEKTLSESMLKETIGGASGGGMQAWAADVFRCCPYPASAFWDAPYISQETEEWAFHQVA